MTQKVWAPQCSQTFVDFLVELLMTFLKYSMGGMFKCGILLHTFYLFTELIEEMEYVHI